MVGILSPFVIVDFITVRARPAGRALFAPLAYANHGFGVQRQETGARAIRERFQRLVGSADGEVRRMSVLTRFGRNAASG